ncbi:hypothetical protein E3C22_06555 [Jiella endophytica]|uniref:Putative Flp pilus-assembly TadG-like N-terminal domain-containing protein n=1 Tax=Jiella endophytica TaxID=2558362 RepID=A0A4Y8RN87_9HYPH|nr:pilus assembly protein TadG-related protein [Jiella endophytica]TFF25039.1 hypothetical protein E3C22_06555 [Jiella endophytica]
MSAPLASLRRLRRAEAGSIVVTFALSLPIVLGCAAFALDLGAAYLERRSLQAATDAAALAAASRPADADNVIDAVLAANGFAEARHTLVYGIYRDDPNIDRDARFLPAGSGNAIRVRAETTWPFVFGRVLGLQDLAISSRSEAALLPSVSLSAGSRLASLDPKLINAFLDPLLGLNVNLTAADYQWLARAQIGLGALGRRLADTLSEIPDASAAVVLQHDFPLSTVTTAMSQELTVTGNYLGASILQKASYSPLAVATTVRLADIVDLDERQERLAANYPASALTARLNVLDIAGAAIRPNGIGNAVSAEIDLAPAGSVQADVLLAEAMQSARSIAAGGVGTRVTTDQLRMRLVASTFVDLAGAKALQLPVEVVAAGGTAEVIAATCGASLADREVRVAVTPGLVRASIGQFAKPLAAAAVGDSLAEATIVDVLLARISARANVAVEQTTPIVLTFRGSEIGNGTVKTARTQTLASSLIRRLIEETDVSVDFLGLGLSGPIVRGTVRDVLTALAAPLDEVANGILAITGAGLGELDVRVDGLDCSRARLVG